MACFNTSLAIARIVEFTKIYFKDCCSIFFTGSSPRWELVKQKERFSGHYFDLKRRYIDLLDRQDIDRILNNDREFSQDLEFINAKLKIYSFMWLMFLISMFVSTWFLYWWYK